MFLLHFLQFLNVILELIKWVVIAQVIISWLLAFNILNMSNQFVAMIANALFQVTQPLLAPIRRYVPTFGGLDVSPIVLFLIILFIQGVVFPTIIDVAYG